MAVEIFGPKGCISIGIGKKIPENFSGAFYAVRLHFKGLLINGCRVGNIQKLVSNGGEVCFTEGQGPWPRDTRRRWRRGRARTPPAWTGAASAGSVGGEKGATTLPSTPAHPTPPCPWTGLAKQAQRPPPWGSGNG